MLSFALGFGLGALLLGGLIFLWLKGRVLRLEGELKVQQSLQRSSEQQSQLMREQFERLASQIVEEKTSRWSDLSQNNLSLLLDPFKERLKDFERKVDEVYAQERTERGSLKGEISKLLELNLKMTKEANDLTKALRGDVKTQGLWGEQILENILERSGLRKDEEYITQTGHKNAAGDNIRPDVIVRLPDEKHLIIDAKVSLLSFDEYVRSEQPSEQDRFAKAFADSLKKHIDGLAERRYHSAEGYNSPDFVMLFMPIEPAFALAFKIRPELFQHAWEKQIAIVSPTTLLTTLKTVATLWKQDRQEKNALEIAKRGGALYDKFALFLQDLKGVGEKMDAAQKSYQGAINKLSDGHGNLIGQVEKLRELGAKAEKRLPQLQKVIAENGSDLPAL